MHRILALPMTALLIIAGQASAQNAQQLRDVLKLDTKAKLFAFFLAPEKERQRILQVAAIVKSGRVIAAKYNDLLLLGRYHRLFEVKKAEPFIRELERQTGFTELATIMKIGPNLRSIARDTYVRIDEIERRRARLYAKLLAKTPPNRWRAELGERGVGFVLRYRELFGAER